MKWLSPVPIGYFFNGGLDGFVAAFMKSLLPTGYLFNMKIDGWIMAPAPEFPIPTGYFDHTKCSTSTCPHSPKSPIPIGYLSNGSQQVQSQSYRFPVANSHWVSIQLDKFDFNISDFEGVANSHWVSLQREDEGGKDSEPCRQFPLGISPTDFDHHQNVSLPACRQFPLGISPTSRRRRRRPRQRPSFQFPLGISPTCLKE